MLKNYFRVAFRNFRRNKAFSAINILGLAIGISASLIIVLLVYYDFTFDKFEKDRDRIYRIVATGTFEGNTWHGNALSEPMGPAVEKDMTGLDVVVPFTTADEMRVTVPSGDGGRLQIFRKQKDAVYADKRYFDLIRYTWLAGSPAASLSQPYQVVLTEKKARLYFPKLNYNDIVGKTITFNDTILAAVTGIVKDISENTDFYFNTFISRSTIYTSRLKPEGFGKWGWTNSADQLFVRLSPGNTAARTVAQLNRLWKKYNPPDPNNHGGGTFSVELQPLADIHFNTDYGVFDESRQAHKPTLYGLLAVAGFLLLLACINFINLSTAQASQRAKEIGIRKTMGSHRRQLTAQFLTETFVLTILATLLSIALTPLLLKVFGDFIPEDFHFSPLRQPLLLVFLVVLVIVVSILAGLYPAIVMSAFKPVMVLKNQAFAGSGKTRGAWLRKTLTVSQFVIAQVFLIGTLLVTKQISFALSKDLGFRRDAIVYFRTNYNEPPQKRDALVQQLHELPGIAMISIASNPPSSNGTWTSTMTYNDGKKEIIQNVEWKVADSNYFRMFGLHLLAGNAITQSDTTNSIVINTAYLHILGFQDPRQAVDKIISGGRGKQRIVGVMADFNQRSIHESIKPLLIANGTKTSECINIALRPQNGNTGAWPATMAKIEKAFKTIYPNDDFEYQFIDDTIAKFYTAEKNTANLLVWSAGLTIFISCLGLLGLVIYITNQRTKEIGIRKVIGASITQIIFLLSKDFLKLIGLAILIAIPIAWWGANKWLEDFAYKTQLNWWVFALGGAALLVIALIVLCLRTFRAAAVNPVRSLRSE
ncbi:MAG TPA: FtsX-like permease family protein [Puia sp.]|nr:FtsX-like permease family protein [Puia sp.]